MAGIKGARFSDEARAKILSEAEQKKCSVSQVIRERIEQSYVQEEIKDLEQKLSRIEARIIEIGPQTRRAENLSWWTVTLLAEFMKHKLGPEKFRIIERTADKKFDVYRHTRELEF
jgi:vacuolar-type H+-ATPase subunit I/STV1